MKTMLAIWPFSLRGRHGPGRILRAPKPRWPTGQVGSSSVVGFPARRPPLARRAFSIAHKKPGFGPGFLRP